MDFIQAIEKILGKKASMNMIALQPGEVETTWADVEELVRNFDYAPSTPIEEGVDNFIEWYRSFYRV